MEKRFTTEIPRKDIGIEIGSMSLSISFSISTTILCLLFIGCVKQYKHTAKVCNDKFYVEIFNINPAGVDCDYITDSTNFRLYVGKWDNEHENFTYSCVGDSLFIDKIGISDITGKFQILEKKAYYLPNLKKNKVFE